MHTQRRRLLFSVCCQSDRAQLFNQPKLAPTARMMATMTSKLQLESETKEELIFDKKQTFAIVFFLLNEEVEAKMKFFASFDDSVRTWQITA